MQEYYFLFVIGFFYILFGAIQDLKTREVANWLNFSLLTFTLAYRAFYSAWFKDPLFFVYGVCGIAFFVVCAYVLYYGRVFAGGDAKLLMALGGIFPYSSFQDIILVGISYVILLLTLGAAYSFMYSSYIAYRSWKRFSKLFLLFIGTYARLLTIWLVINLVWLVIIVQNPLLFIASFILLITPFLYGYLKSVEQCMILRVSPRRLTLGDWLAQPVRIGTRVIHPSIHGLSSRDIALLQRTQKRVLLKQGVPFVPAFMFSFLVMVYAAVYGWLEFLLNVILNLF